MFLIAAELHISLDIVLNTHDNTQSCQRSCSVFVVAPSLSFGGRLRCDTAIPTWLVAFQSVQQKHLVLSAV
ncbi:MAG: hypothetical protein RR263_05395, partial [Oscillospiraceae bacterium]